MWRMDFGGRAARALLIAALALVFVGVDRSAVGRDPVRPGDDWTFRPTVMVRRGTSQGTGTVIASVDGETLILTAGHVVRGHDPLIVELHRYNLGLENRSVGGPWPRALSAEVAALDAAADVAILRVGGMTALPYVARILDADDRDSPENWLTVTSVGIDRGAKLSSWDSVLVETANLRLGEAKGTRPFFITARPPEHGRSGGGLFTTDGRLIGVCVGHAEILKGRRMGVFSTIDNARRLLRGGDLAAVVSESSARQAARRRTTANRPATDRRSPELIPTDAR